MGKGDKFDLIKREKLTEKQITNKTASQEFIALKI